jgi:hypothetical protein
MSNESSDKNARRAARETVIEIAESRSAAHARGKLCHWQHGPTLGITPQK